jgi:ribose transport system permease protein
VNSGQPTLGDGRELDAVAAVLIGGVRLGGGEGSLWKIALAATFLTTLDNGLSLANVSSFWQDVAVGLIIAVAALANAYRARGMGPWRFIKSLFHDVSGKRRAERI